MRSRERDGKVQLLLTCRVVPVSFVSPLLEHIVWHPEENTDVQQIYHFLSPYMRQNRINI